MRLIFVGPSHIPRIKHAFEVVKLPCKSSGNLYIGDGGFPIWKKSLMDECLKSYRPGDRVIIIFPDFRFGNKILKSNFSFERNVFYDGFTHVDRELCSIEHDKKMRELCVKALIEWRKLLGGDLVILHWTLAMRTIKNRINKRYTNSDGVYLHPTWNLTDNDLQGDVYGLSELQTSNNIQLCNMLTLDNDLHPSTLGFLYIANIAVRPDHNIALLRAQKNYMSGMNFLVDKLKKSSTCKAVICGDSILIKFLEKFIPLSIRESLIKIGINIVSSMPSSLNLKESSVNIILVSKSVINTMDDFEKERRSLLTSIANVKPVSIIFWESITKQVMGWRARKSRKIPSQVNDLKISKELFNSVWTSNGGGFSFAELDRFVEYGAGGVPTIWAVMKIIALAYDFDKSSFIADGVMAAMEESFNKNLDI